MAKPESHLSIAEIFAFDPPTILFTMRNGSLAFSPFYAGALFTGTEESTGNGLKWNMEVFGCSIQFNIISETLLGN